MLGVTENNMGLRRYRFCRMRTSPAFTVTVCIGMVLLIANYLRSSKGSGDEEIVRSMHRGSVRSVIRDLQGGNQGKHRKRIRLDDEDEQPFQICRTPQLSLQNDANAFAFYALPRLNCTVDSLFYTRKGALYLNQTVLAGRILDRCEYKAITWETDSYYSYTEPLIRKEPPFEMKVKHDFFKIECYLKTDKNSDVNEQPKVENRHQNRKLLQLPRINQGQRNVWNEQQNIQGNMHQNYNNRYQNTQNTQYDLKDNQVQNDGVHLEYRQNIDIGRKNTIQKGNNVQNYEIPQRQEIQPKASMQYNSPNNIAFSNRNINDGKHVNYMDSTMKKNDNIAQRLGPVSGYGDTNHKASIVQPKEPPTFVRSPVQLRQQLAPPSELHVNNDRGNGGDNAGLLAHNTKEAANEPEKEKVAALEGDMALNKKDEEKDNVQEGDYDDHSNPNYDDGVEDYQYVAPEVPDFEQFVVQVLRRDDVVKRIKDITPHKHSTQMNVLMFAMDSMSHLSYQRKMPKTYEYVKNKLRAVILNSYNIVGDATTAAIIPMLTGRNVEELPEVRKSQPGSTYLDAYPLIWNRFEQNGYATLLAEDEPTLSVFNLRFNGFEEIPTDHYMRHFWLASHASNLYDISPRFCLGRTKRHQFLLDYMKKFHLVYKDVPTFSFNMMTEYTHSNNNPAQYVDEDLVKTLETLRRNNVLENTLVIVFGDHGARYSQVRGTIQGKMEERLPMMSFAFPEWFRKKHPKLMKNLETNANRLTTPFDIYETLRDVLDIRRSETPVTFKERGISLLKEIPINRTCASAGIDMHWCTCMHWRPVDGFEVEAKAAAGQVVALINEFTERHRHMCQELSLLRIEDAKMVFPNEKVLTFMKTIDGDQRIANFSRDVDIDLIHYQIIVETSPNHGLYEATVAYHVETKTYKVYPQISRINVYGDQASCVIDKLPDLRKYCLCKHKRDEG